MLFGHSQAGMSYHGLQDSVSGKAIVMACGPTAYAFEPPEDPNILIIGCNDAEYYLSIRAKRGIDVLFIFDRPDKFTPRRIGAISMTEAPVIIMRDDPQMRHWADLLPDGNKRVLWVEGGSPWQTRKTQRCRLSLGKPSPWVCVMIAEFMGATDIGVIGMDLLAHQWGEPANLSTMERKWGHLHQRLEERGVKLTNLSDISMLQCLPKQSMKEWLKS